MPDYSREELIAELKRRRGTQSNGMQQPQTQYQPQGLQGPIEPNVPEWAGRYPNIYGLAGAAREAVQPMMRGSLIDVGLSRAVGYPTPEFMTEQEQMSLPIAAGLFSRTPPAPRPQILVRQHPQSGQWMAQIGGLGGESRVITAGLNKTDVMKKAKEMFPDHDILGR